MELSEYMGSIDILINPSNSPQETFCMVNIEAMALGIPVVSFGMYGQGEYFSFPGAQDSDKNAMIATELSPTNLSLQTIQLIRNTTLRALISRNAVQTSMRFSPQRSAETFFSAMVHVYNTFVVDAK